MTQASAAIAILCIWMCAPAEAQRRRARPVPKPVDIVAGVAPEPDTPDSVNRRWSAARWQIRSPLDLIQKAAGGRERSRWVRAPVLPGDRKFQFRLAVRDRKLLDKQGYLSRRKTVRPGTMFAGAGWRLENPRKRAGLVLDLQFEGLPVRARME